MARLIKKTFGSTIRTAVIVITNHDEFKNLYSYPMAVTKAGTVMINK